MRIRSITYFCNPGAIPKAGKFLKVALGVFKDAGFEVQSLRLATPPFASWMTSLQPEAAAIEARQIEQAAGDAGIAYVSVGPAMPEDEKAQAAVIPILTATQNIFCSGILGDSERGVYLPAVSNCAEIIRQAANITPDGFGNLRFTAMANVKAGSPFFPAAYARAEGESFALAIEAADLAVDAFTRAGSLDDAQRNLVQSIEEHAGRMTAAAESLAAKGGPEFSGIDFTLSTFPDEAISMGTAIERLGVPAAGLAGSLAAAAFITSCVDMAKFKRTGFSGLMLPVLEDATLARRAAEGTLLVNDLLMYSAVCGTGLDTIPLPGDLGRGRISAVLLDLAALACRLDKPLTARLMPIPGKKAGEETGFNFAFFANSRVMDVKAEDLSNLMVNHEWLPVLPRHPGRG